MVWRPLTKDDLRETKNRFAAGGYELQWYAMASEVILTTLGPDWWTTNCTLESATPDPFLKVHDGSPDGRYEHQSRIVLLGHMLYAFGGSPGFEEFLRGLKSADLEAAFFELWVADALRANGFEIEFVARRGRRGDDYDLLARREGAAIHVEAKSRREGLLLNPATLKNPLQSARKQLPSSGPGAVFVSIPGQWAREVNAARTVRECVDSFVRATGRINWVVLVWSHWLPLAKGQAHVFKFKEFAALKARTPLRFSGLLARLGDAPAPFNPSFW